MLTTFDTNDILKQFKWERQDIERLRNYERYRNLYRSNFAKPFANVLRKIRQRYPLGATTAQSLVEINLFKALTDFFKILITNNDFRINLDEQYQDTWRNIAKYNNFIAVLKEVCIDNSRFGDALFKVAFVDGIVRIFSICPDCWFPVFNNGNLNDLAGHILIYDIVQDGKEYKHIEKIHRGWIENEVWEVANNKLSRQVEDVGLFGLKSVDDFSDKWDGFVLFHVKNTTESDCYYGESDYKACESIIEEIMLTVSQNSKIINRHANPKLSGSIQNTELNPQTGQRTVPNSDFIVTGPDGIKPEYITADLQAEAIKSHIDTLMQFFYILTKTPPQAYGVDLSGNMSGESLQKIFMSAISKVEDIRAVSLNNAIECVIECALAFSGYKNVKVSLDWGEAVKLDYTELVKTCNDRVLGGTQSKISAIMQMDKVNKEQAEEELKQIIEEQSAESAAPLEDVMIND